MFQRHRRKVRALAMLLAIAAADVLGTAVLRGLGLYTPAGRAEAGFRRQDPVYHHGLRPCITSEDGGRWGQRRYTVHTNSLGFKDASPRQVPAHGDARRLLFIGDSFTEGAGVPFAASFVGLVAKELSGKGIEVLNAGCVTYSPVIYRRRVQELLDSGRLHFDHLVVCLDMSDIVDEIKYYDLDAAGNVVRRSDSLADVLKDFVANNTLLMKLIRDGLHELREGRRTGDRHVIGHERSSWTRDPSLWEKYGKPGLASADRHLDALWRLLQERSIGMTLVVYPWPDQILNAERECAQVTFWREWTRTRGVPFVDLFPAFLDAGPAAEVIDRCFIPQDMHWNECGHAVVAAGLLAQLHL